MLAARANEATIANHPCGGRACDAWSPDDERARKQDREGMKKQGRAMQLAEDEANVGVRQRKWLA
jgi:hypothetical protein